MESPQAVNLQSSGEDGNAQRAVLLANATARDAWTIVNDLRGSDGSDELSAGSGDLSKRAQNGGVDRGWGGDDAKSQRGRRPGSVYGRFRSNR